MYLALVLVRHSSVYLQACKGNPVTLVCTCMVETPAEHSQNSALKSLYCHSERFPPCASGKHWGQHAGSFRTPPVPCPQRLCSSELRCPGCRPQRRRATFVPKAVQHLVFFCVTNMLTCKLLQVPFIAPQGKIKVFLIEFKNSAKRHCLNLICHTFSHSQNFEISIQI